MRISLSLVVLSFVVLGANPLVVGQTKYGVTVQTSKAAALTQARTYAWDTGRRSFDKDVDAMIVAAVDRELAVRGFMKLPSGPGDLIVRYASQSRTDTDVNSKASSTGEQRTYAVGSLVVDLSDATNRQVLFRVRMDTPIARDPATIGATIDAAVAAMFEKYPMPKR
jgi:hypothetical protein